MSGWDLKLFKVPLLKLGGGGSGLSTAPAVRGFFDTERDRPLPVEEKLVYVPADGSWVGIGAESDWGGAEVRRESVDCLELDMSSSFLAMCKPLLEELLPVLTDEVEGRRTCVGRR